MSKRPPPRWILYALTIGVVLSWLPLVLIAKARVAKMAKPRIHIIQDMDAQPKYKTQSANPLFADGRAMRPRIPGTVAQGELHEDDHFWRGKVGGHWATTFPMEITERLVRHGQERYGIYCAPCHGMSGYGNGPIHQRAVEKEYGTWVPPTSLHTDEVRERPAGHLFNTITHGIRNMPAYGPQIPAEDRWAIVAYVRALQLSQRATLDDVPADKRDALR